MNGSRVFEGTRGCKKPGATLSHEFGAWLVELRPSTTGTKHRTRVTATTLKPELLFETATPRLDVETIRPAIRRCSAVRGETVAGRAIVKADFPSLRRLTQESSGLIPGLYSGWHWQHPVGLRLSALPNTFPGLRRRNKGRMSDAPPVRIPSYLQRPRSPPYIDIMRLGEDPPFLGPEARGG